MLPSPVISNSFERGGNGVPETLSGRLNIDLTNEMYWIVSKLITQSTRNTYRSATSDKNGPQVKVRESWTVCTWVVLI